MTHGYYSGNSPKLRGNAVTEVLLIRVAIIPVQHEYFPVVQVLLEWEIYYLAHQI
ncbi:hypothetical protein NIES4072_61630 [Nostoc commune NIES-4072]|uniref:Uncharacterized protein n=1 Tax=Nostoc commune NIES-4072 TaxID=2005467 RepID=A0A2R5FUL0_NOSCO|nr:hypothetical protein [Nostoc commune]BBD66567.1 hypothetical protein NIES4070_29330 [Nostoc commune HK-02]GBG22452.1 hypothetical protein NIES4072_61630 [Nostoc commune NIES-4072]